MVGGRLVLVVLVVLAGCGRIGFDPLGDGAGAFDASTEAFFRSVTSFSSPSPANSRIGVAIDKPQVGGDVVLLFIGWHGASSSVSAISDTFGTQYVALGSVAQFGTVSQVAYRATAAPAAEFENFITIDFAPAAAQPSMRMVFYGGANSGEPIRGAEDGGGAGVSACDSVLIQASAGDVLVGVNTASVPAAAGGGFTVRDVTAPGDLVEDKPVTVDGMDRASVSIEVGDCVIHAVVLAAPG